MTTRHEYAEPDPAVDRGAAREHFAAHVEATVWRLLAWLEATVGEDGLRRTLADFPLLQTWLDSALNRLGGDPQWAEGAARLEQLIGDAEAAADGALPLAASAVCGTGFAGRLALILAGLPEEDSRFGSLFATLQAPLAGRRPCAELIDCVVGAARISERLAAAGWIELTPPQAARAERSAQVPDLLWRALRGDFRGDAVTRLGPGLRLTPQAVAGDWNAIALPDDLRTTLRRLPALLADGRLDGVVLRAGPGGDGGRVLATLARDLKRALLEFDPAASGVAIVGPLAAAIGALPVALLDPAPGEIVDWPQLTGYRGPQAVLLGDGGSLATPETLRSLAFRLPLPDTVQRAALLRRCLPPMAGGAALSSEQLAALAQGFRLAPEWLRRAAPVALAKAALDGRQNASAADFAAACRELGRPLLDGLTQPVEPVGGPSDLVAGPETSMQMAELERRCRHRDWSGEGVRALFSGPSGTGKTLAARALAAMLTMDLYRVDLASVVNKYIGETEKNLHRVLSRAEALDIILLLDEGDALLGRRTEVRTANDRYANLETNYLLTRLENYRGIVVVTTNAAEHIDTAFLRRMDVVVGFPRPERPERERLWLTHLPAGHALAWPAIESLALRCALTGAQIRNACRHAALLARDAGRDGPDLTDIECGVRAEYGKTGASCPLDAAQSDAGPAAMRAFLTLIAP